MNSDPSKKKPALGSAPFTFVWGLIAVSAIIGGVVFVVAPLIPTLVIALLLLGVIALGFLGVYKATQQIPGATIERNELTSIFSVLEDAFIVYDGNFAVTFFNAAAEKLFKLSSVDILGHRLSPRDVESDNLRTLAQVIFPSLAPQVVTRSAEGQYPAIAEISFTNPELELRVTTAPVVDENGKTVAFMKLVRDLTPQTLALRAKDDFITVASHQLRGPVTDISWALEALAGATELSDTNKAIVQNAVAASKGLLRRIEDFLDVSRLEGGRITYDFQPTNIIDFLQATLADVMPAARTAGIKLYFDRPNEELPPAYIDPRRLAVVVVNLIENAIRYNVENGEVIVKVEPVVGRPFIEVSVRDTGIGIPPDALPKLFQKFFRAENAVKSQTEGSGIGLYIARDIIVAHGGEIRAESEIGRGTAIRFTVATDPNLVPHHAVAA